jgi:hypothetical protein
LTVARFASNDDIGIKRRLVALVVAAVGLGGCRRLFGPRPLAVRPPAGIAVALMIGHNKGGVKPMLEQYLVRNTTRQEREKIIRDSLGCGGGGCENCSACGVYGAGDPLDMYQPYIEGLKEIEDINREFKARYFL